MHKFGIEKSAPNTKLDAHYSLMLFLASSSEALEFWCCRTRHEVVKQTLLLLLIAAFDKGIVYPLHEPISLTQVILFLVTATLISVVAVIAMFFGRSPAKVVE